MQEIKRDKTYILGPHNGIGGTVKRKVYQEVLSDHLVVRDARHFAEEANSICDIQGIFLTIPYPFMVQNDSMHKCII